MVQVLQANPRRSFADQVLGGLNEAVPQLQQYFQGQNKNKALQNLTGKDLGALDPEMQKAFVVAHLQGKNEEKKQQMKQQQKNEFYRMLGLDQQREPQAPQNRFADSLQEPITPEQAHMQSLAGEQASQGQQKQPQGQKDPQSWYNGLNEKQRNLLALENPAAANALENGRKFNQTQDLAERKHAQNEEKFEHQKNIDERNYHSSFVKKAIENADNLRASLPKLEMALDFARNAIETGDMSYLSPDKLADVTGADIFRTAKGSQLIAAGKENLLNNISRVSAKAQNVWFEQRLASVFPKIGQSKEANLTVQEMLEAERLIDRAYLNEFDRLTSEDQKQYGFEKKDIEKRARDAVKPIEKDILRRTTYRMKEIEEEESGLNKIKDKVGINVSKGTPLTMAMAKLYKDKFGDKALAVAEKNGYFIPTVEEYKMIRASTPEFRESLQP